MTRTLLIVTGLSALALAGCGGGKGGRMLAPSPPMTIQRLEDQFGAGFGTAFRVDRNVEPGDPAGGDIEPLTLIAEPREVN